MTLEITPQIARRFVLGRQGLWPGRRWHGLAGTEQAMRAIEHLQLDPLVLLARAHDLILHARVDGYRQGDWATLAYEQRKFFDWGGWLAVRPMDELPHWRVVMRRELEEPRWIEVQREHPEAIDEMRRLLAERGTISNREFEAGARKRVDSYRGRKDSALALYFLWRIGDAMVHHREGFERVYALPEAVAARELIRESDPAEAQDFLMTKAVAAMGLMPVRGIGNAVTWRVPTPEVAAWLTAKVGDGLLVDVRVEGRKTANVMLASDVPLLDDLVAGRVPRAWRPLGPTTIDEAAFLAPLDPVSARGRAKDLFGFDYIWEIYKPATQRRFGPYTMPILWGDRLVGRLDARMDRPASTLAFNGVWFEADAPAADPALIEAIGRGVERLLGFLGAERVDVSALAAGPLRKRLAATAS